MFLLLFILSIEIIYLLYIYIVKCTAPAISVYSLAPVIFRANSLDQ